MRPHLDYIAIIYHKFDPKLNLEFTKKLETVQYSAARTVIGTWRGTNKCKICEELGWKYFYDRRWYVYKFNACLFFYLVCFFYEHLCMFIFVRISSETDKYRPIELNCPVKKCPLYRIKKFILIIVALVNIGKKRQRTK